jgi:type VI secretion system secreted protein Hcp
MAVDMFLKLDAIEGESKDFKHAKEIHIESFSWGMAQTGAFGTGGGGGAGKVSVHDISITKNVDKSSPELMIHTCNGKHIKSGLLTFRKAGENPVEYLKIELEDLLISGVQHAGHGGGDLLSESVTLNAAKFKCSYQEQDENGKPKGGPVIMGWNIKENQKY